MRTQIVRNLSICLLSLTLALTLLPLHAAAEETEDDDPITLFTPIDLTMVRVKSQDLHAVGSFSAEVTFTVEDSSSDLDAGSNLYYAMSDSSLSSAINGSVIAEIEYEENGSPRKSRKTLRAADVTWSSDRSSFTHTCIFPCNPDTAYRFHLLLSAYGAEQSIPSSSGEEQLSFRTTGDYPTLIVRPGGLREVPLENGNMAHFGIAAEQEGHYVLSPEGVSGELYLLNQAGKCWNPLSVRTPVYLKPGQVQYVRFLPDSGAASPVSMELRPFQPDPMILDSILTVPAETENYYRFTPEEDGRCQLKVTAEGSAGHLSVWNPGTQIWEYAISISDGAAFTFSGEAGVPIYFQFSLYNSSCTAVVSKFIPSVTDFSAHSGEASVESPFRSNIPVTLQAPIGASFEARIEYQVNGTSGVSSDVRQFSQNNSEQQTFLLSLGTFPGAVYKYRVLINVFDDSGHMITRSVREAEEKELTAEALSPIELTPGQTHSLTQWGYYLLCLTAEETGVYTVSASDQGKLILWDASRVQWAGQEYNADSQVRFFLSAGASQYIQCKNAGSACQLTSSVTTSGVTDFSLQAGTPAAEAFTAVIPLTGSMPLGSSFRLGYELLTPDGEGSGPRYVHTYDLYADDSFSSSIQLTVLPNTDYRLRIFLEDINERDKRLAQCTAEFRTGEFQTAALASGVPQLVLMEQGGASYFRFTPNQDGVFELAVEGMAAGSLSILDQENTRWVNLKSLSGSALVTAEGKAGVPQYIRLLGKADCSICVSEIRRQLLTVSSLNGQITMSLEAAKAGTYLFSLYDEDGRFLRTALQTKSAAGSEVLTVSLPESGASAVKAFGVNERYQPQLPAEAQQLLRG